MGSKCRGFCWVVGVNLQSIVPSECKKWPFEGIYIHSKLCFEGECTTITMKRRWMLIIVHWPKSYCEVWLLGLTITGLWKVTNFQWIRKNGKGFYLSKTYTAPDKFSRSKLISVQMTMQLWLVTLHLFQIRSWYQYCTLNTSPKLVTRVTSISQRKL